MPKISKNQKPFYKKWWFWVIVVVVVIFIGVGASGNNENNSDSSQNKQTSKWSEMTLGDKKILAENACQDANNYSGKINLNDYDIVSLAYLWDSWSSLYADWSSESKKIEDAAKTSETKSGLPIYNYRWNGNYKADNDKRKAVFDCWFSVDENNSNKIDILWLKIDDSTISGSESLIFSE